MRLLNAAAVGLLFGGCGPTSSDATNGSAAPTVLNLACITPSSPIVSGFDTTWVVVADYALPLESVDSVLTARGEHLPLRDGRLYWTGQPEQALSFVQFWAHGTSREIPLLPSVSEPIVVKAQFSGMDTDPGSVHLVGGFNGWTDGLTPMSLKNGVWHARLVLPAGNHPYQVSVDGTWQLNPAASDSLSNGMGGWNSILSVGSGERPLDFDITGVETDGVVHDLMIKAPAGTEVFAWWDDHLYSRFTIDENHPNSVRVPAAAYGLSRSHLRVWCVDGDRRSEEQLVPLAHGVPIENTDELTREDWHAMVMYFLLVDRFSNGDESNDEPVDDPGIHPLANHMGGDLEGVRAEIKNGYFDELGINTIWVSPITQNAEDAWGYWQDESTEVTSKFSGYHGYWPVSSSKVDRHFGTNSTFNDLVDEAHASSFNVIMDYVANHVHEDHPIYVEHPDWATNLYLPDGSLNTERWDDHRLTTWFDVFLPTLDLARPEVYEAMVDSVLWWITNSKIDGFRHDATKHIPEVFWRHLTREAKGALASVPERRLFQIGETYGSPELIGSYVMSGMLDAQFDFNHYDAMINAIALDGSWSDLVGIAEESLKAYGAHHLMGNLTGNQDRPRFTSLADGSVKADEDTKLAGWTRDIQHAGSIGFQRMQLLTAYLMSVPGIPCIYQGDEIADVGGNDPDNRRMMRFDALSQDEESTRSHAAEWIELRRARMSLLYGSTRFEVVSPALLRITRTYIGETTTVYLNKSSNPERIDIGSTFTLLAGDAIVNGSTLTVPAMSAVAVAPSGRPL